MRKLCCNDPIICLEGDTVARIAAADGIRPMGFAGLCHRRKAAQRHGPTAHTTPFFGGVVDRQKRRRRVMYIVRLVIRYRNTQTVILHLRSTTRTPQGRRYRQSILCATIKANSPISNSLLSNVCMLRFIFISLN